VVLFVGRDAGDIILHDTQVSERHGKFTWDGFALLYINLESTNGSDLIQGHHGRRLAGHDQQERHGVPETHDPKRSAFSP